MPGSWAASTFAVTPTASTARGSSALTCARSIALTMATPGTEVSRRGACARSAWRVAARSADGLGLATTTTGEEVNNLCATPTATTSGDPASTDVADAGRRVRAARRTGAGGSCRAALERAALEQDVAPTATAAHNTSIALVVCRIQARLLPGRELPRRRCLDPSILAIMAWMPEDRSE